MVSVLSILSALQRLSGSATSGSALSKVEGLPCGGKVWYNTSWATILRLRSGQAYGETRWVEETLLTDYRFTGQRQAASLGLYQMRARWVDASLGRWLSADTVVPQPGEPQAFNRYSYVAGNPLRYTDPSGHAADERKDVGDVEPPTIEEVVAEILQSMADAIYDPGRTEPIQITLPDGTLLVIMPVGSNSVPQRSPGLENASRLLSGIGLGMDALELAFIWSPATPQQPPYPRS